MVIMETKKADTIAGNKFVPSPEQIAKWQKQGDVFAYEVDGLACYLKRPSRQVVELATAEGANRPFKFTEIVLANCWLDGNDELRTEDKYFMGLSGKIAELIEIKTGELKKL
jgi:hypothetical protein